MLLDKQLMIGCVVQVASEAYAGTATRTPSRNWDLEQAEYEMRSELNCETAQIRVRRHADTLLVLRVPGAEIVARTLL